MLIAERPFVEISQRQSLNLCPHYNTDDAGLCHARRQTALAQSRMILLFPIAHSLLPDCHGSPSIT